jgi:hypothetical protein
MDAAFNKQSHMKPQDKAVNKFKPSRLKPWLYSHILSAHSSPSPSFHQIIMILGQREKYLKINTKIRNRKIKYFNK